MSGNILSSHKNNVRFFIKYLFINYLFKIARIARWPKLEALSLTYLTNIARIAKWPKLETLSLKSESKVKHRDPKP